LNQLHNQFLRVLAKQTPLSTSLLYNPELQLPFTLHTATFQRPESPTWIPSPPSIVTGAGPLVAAAQGISVCTCLGFFSSDHVPTLQSPSLTPSQCIAHFRSTLSHTCLHCIDTKNIKDPTPRQPSPTPPSATASAGEAACGAWRARHRARHGSPRSLEPSRTCSIVARQIRRARRGESDASSDMLMKSGEDVDALFNGGAANVAVDVL